ncbi:unnamed protein product [Amoebophrya sp. A25]|nr:unnamed protein product [Amoebophrya sp. A25]|eukprot:GSA25T00017566001.1
MAAGSDIKYVSFVGIGHCKSRNLVCTWNSHNMGPAYDDVRVDTVKKVVGAATKRLEPGTRQRLEWDGTSLYVLKDALKGDYVYVVLVNEEEDQGHDDVAFGDDLAYNLLLDLRTYVEQRRSTDMESNDAMFEAAQDGASELFRDKIKSLVQKYDRVPALEEESARKPVVNHGDSDSEDDLDFKREKGGCCPCFG